MMITRHLNKPMTRWPNLIKNGRITTRVWDLEREASNIAVHAARFSAYLSRRINGGNHADAVRHQNNVAAKVRAALGYTQRRSDIRF